VIFLLAVALAQDALTLPVGRAAVLALEAPPTALATSNDRFRVEQMPPYLVLVGVRAGEGTFTLTQESGPRTVDVTVPAEGTVVGEGFDATSTPVALGVDQGFLLPLPPDTESHLLVRPDVAQVVPFGHQQIWVQGRKRGITDFVVERRAHPPRILTLAVGEPSPPPADAHPVSGTYTLAVGGTLAIDLGTVPVGQLVGHPDRVRVRETSDPAASLELVGLATGTTWLLTAHLDGDVRVHAIEVTGP
jgi:hypothetical protein